MDKILSKKEAVEFLKIDPKTFENYFKNADEFKCLERNGGRGRFRFNEDELKKWKESNIWRTINLNIKDYALCLDFALAQHFKGYVISDFGTARQREFGQKITNWVKGQLGEIAVQKFFKREFNFDIELDFNIYDQIVPQDIIGVYEKSKKRTPNIGVGIKSSKPKSAYLVLGDNEIKLPERRSEIYIYCRPDIPDDHLLRIAKDEVIELVKDKPLYPRYKYQIPSFANIPCEVAGWCKASELKEVTSIPGQTFENGTRFVIKSGLLHRSKKDWEKLLKLL
jgi:hypothetical protein